MRVLAASFVILAACSKSGGGGAPAAPSCPALEVTIDGARVAPPPHAVAFSSESFDSTTWQVDLFPQPITCEQRLSGAPVAQPIDTAMGAWVGGGGLSMTASWTVSKENDRYEVGAAYGSHQHYGGTVRVLGDPPHARGDELALCIDAMRFTDDQHRTITMHGRIAGPFCGEWHAFVKAGAP